MSNKTITLSTHEELKIYMSPQRQNLMRHLRTSKNPLTPKKLADLMEISASSVQHHIRKLIQLGVVELDHTEIINGINARYYRLTNVTVSIGSPNDDRLSSERITIMQNILKDNLDGIIKLSEMDIPKTEMANLGDFLSGAVYLTNDDSRKLMKLIKNFILSHETKAKDTQPWEYALMIYNAEVIK